MNLTMKKRLIFIGGCALAVLGFTGAGCERLPIADTTTSPSAEVTHIVMREVNPDDFSEDTTGDTFDVYLSDVGARAEVSETIIVDGLEPDATTMYFYADPATKMEYLFTYPNELAPEDRQQLPDDDPLQKAEHVIMALSMEKRPSGPSDQSLIELMLQPVLSFPTDQLQATASSTYSITDTYMGYPFVGEEAPGVERRTTINPDTNLPTRVELIDASSKEPIETFVIDTYVIEDQSQYAADFFSLDGWKKSLPGEDHYIAEEDITQ